MKITVSYSELVSGPGYNNRQAKAEIEVSVENSNQLETTFQKAWERAKREVKKQLHGENEALLSDLIPF